MHRPKRDSRTGPRCLSHRVPQRGLFLSFGNNNYQRARARKRKRGKDERKREKKRIEWEGRREAPKWLGDENACGVHALGMMYASCSGEMRKTGSLYVLHARRPFKVKSLRRCRTVCVCTLVCRVCIRNTYTRVPRRHECLRPCLKSGMLYARCTTRLLATTPNLSLSERIALAANVC